MTTALLQTSATRSQSSPSSRKLGLPRPITPIGVHGRWRAAPALPAELNIHDVTLLAEFASGLTIPAIGHRLGISERTVRRRIRTVCEQLDVATPIEAVAWAARHRLV